MSYHHHSYRYRVGLNTTAPSSSSSSSSSRRSFGQRGRGTYHGNHQDTAREAYYANLKRKRTPSIPSTQLQQHSHRSHTHTHTNSVARRGTRAQTSQPARVAGADSSISAVSHQSLSASSSSSSSSSVAGDRRRITSALAWLEEPDSIDSHWRSSIDEKKSSTSIMADDLEDVDDDILAYDVLDAVAAVTANPIDHTEDHIIIDNGSTSTTAANTGQGSSAAAAPSSSASSASSSSAPSSAAALNDLIAMTSSSRRSVRTAKRTKLDPEAVEAAKVAAAAAALAKLREKVVHRIDEAFKSSVVYLPDIAESMTEGFTKAVAMSIDNALFEFDKSQYRIKARALIAALKDPFNPSLAENLLSGKLSPSVLASTPEADYISEHHMKERQKLADNLHARSVLAAPKGHESTEYMCKLCGHRRTEYIHLTSTIHDARKSETWGSNKDQQLLYEVTCLTCHHRWQVKE
jgi:Transcription factor S-II (TFIIS), central domain